MFNPPTYFCSSLNFTGELGLVLITVTPVDRSRSKTMLAGTMPALVSAEKEQFAVSLLQWYRNALYKNEESAFFDSTRILFFDRFPPPPGDPMSAQYHLEVDAELAVSTAIGWWHG